MNKISSINTLVLLLFGVINAQQNNLADSLMIIGQYSSAISEYQKMNSKSVSYKIAKAYEANGNLKNALDNYVEYRELDSLNVEVNYNYGQLLLELKKYKEAQNIFKKLLQNNSNPVYNYYLGLSFEKDNNLPNALQYYTIASEIDPYYFKSNYKKAVMLVNAQDYQAVLKISNRFIQINELDIEFLKLRGQVFFVQNNFEGAIQDFNKLIALNQTDAFIFEKLAASYYENKEYDKSSTVYTTLIDSSNEEKPEYFFNRAKCYGYLNKMKEAEADIHKSIQLKTFTFENEYFYLAYFHQKAQNLDKALYYYKKVVKEDKSNVEANFQIILINDYKGQKTEKTIKNYQNFLANFKNIPTEKKLYVEERIKQLKRKQHFE
jgi:tetratricopeptide (TPR) repeat protein